MEAIGGVGAVFTVISGVTKLSKNLIELREKYKNVDLSITLVASQLSTIRAALEAIGDWRSAADASSQYSKQLDQDLAVSINCCAILVTVLNSKLGFNPGMKAKMNHLLLEGVLKEYLSNLEGQVHALQLLLTVFQCRSATEQSRRLERAESRTVIDHLRAETASLHHDAASMLSIDISVNLSVDSELMDTPLYKKAYDKYHVHRHANASQSVNERDLSAPAFDHSDKHISNIADEPEGLHYQHRLPRIASTTFAGDDEITGLQTSKPRSHISLEEVAADTSLYMVDHREAPPSIHGHKEMSWNNPMATQDETRGSRGLGQRDTGQKYSRHIVSDKDSTHTSRSERQLSMESDLYAASIEYHPQGRQIQGLSESEGAKSSKDSSPFSLKSSMNDSVNSTLPARADSRIRGLPPKDRTKRRDASSSTFSTKTSSIANPFAHSVSDVETATTTSYNSHNSHNSFGSIDFSSEKEVLSPPAWISPSSNEVFPEIADSQTSTSEPNLPGEQGRVLGSSDAPLSSSPTSRASPRTESLIAGSNQSVPQADFTLTSSTDALQNSAVERMAIERQRVQAELSRLQHELAEAKARGDQKSAQSVIEQSIKLIQKTYLATETSLESKQNLAPAKSTPRRSHIFRMPSLASLTTILTRAKLSQITAAVEAARSGNDTKLEELLDQGINVNARSGDSATLLIQAAMYGHIDCMALLKQRGADELAADYRGLNALHAAVLAGQAAAVEWLLKSYPSTEDKVLHMKLSKTNKSPGRSILQSHRSLREAPDRQGFRPLHIAARHGLADVLNILLEHGANLEAKCNRGGTPLHQAVISSHAQIVRAMLSKGAEIMAADASGRTPLHHAATSSEVDVIDSLLSAGSERSAYDNKGNMPIHLAAGKGRLASVKALKKEPADLEVKTVSGESLLHIAVLMNRLEVVEYLLQNDVDVNPWSKIPPAKLENNGKVIFAKTIRHAPSSTPLHSACFAGQYEIAALLLDHDAWSNAATADDKTPLMLAVESDDTNLVYLLLARKAKVDAKIPNSLLTAQHMAAQLGNFETLQILYQHGANLDACTSDGRCPEHYAHGCKDPAKRAAVLDWFRKVRLRKAAQARELFTLNRQHTADQTQRYSTPATSQVQYQDPMALIRQLSPAYHGFDQRYDTFPEAPPPYVAGPSAPARLAMRDPVYRPAPGT